jgi:hypothetical protein
MAEQEQEALGGELLVTLHRTPNVDDKYDYIDYTVRFKDRADVVYIWQYKDNKVWSCSVFLNTNGSGTKCNSMIDAVLRATEILENHYRSKQETT